MERIKIGESVSTLVLDVTPEQLRDMANKLETRSRQSGMNHSVIMPISNFVSLHYNVPMKVTENIVVIGGEVPTELRQ